MLLVLRQHEVIVQLVQSLDAHFDPASWSLFLDKAAARVCVKDLAQMIFEGLSRLTIFIPVCPGGLCPRLDNLAVCHRPVENLTNQGSRPARSEMRQRGFEWRTIFFLSFCIPSRLLQEPL